jgi:nucleotide-binding universal stress UspA family protein
MPTRRTIVGIGAHGQARGPVIKWASHGVSCQRRPFHIRSPGRPRRPCSSRVCMGSARATMRDSEDLPHRQRDVGVVPGTPLPRPRRGCAMERSASGARQRPRGEGEDSGDDPSSDGLLEEAKQAEREAIRLARRIGAGAALCSRVSGDSALRRARIRHGRCEAHLRNAGALGRGAACRACPRPDEGGVPTRWQRRAGVVDALITETARVEAADYIVIGTHGRSGIARLMLGSIADRVVRTAPCPVLTVRPT